MGSDKGSLLEILLSRKMRLSLFFIIVLVAVSGIQSEDNSENESGISKEAIKAVAQDNVVGMDFQKTLYREKRGGKENGKAKKKGTKGKKKGTRNMKKGKGNSKIGKGTKSGKGNKSRKGNRSGKGNIQKKKGNKSTSRATGKKNKSKAKMNKSPNLKK